jgi:hypothetical protein
MRQTNVRSVKITENGKVFNYCRIDPISQKKVSLSVSISELIF